MYYKLTNKENDLYQMLKRGYISFRPAITTLACNYPNTEGFDSYFYMCQHNIFCMPENFACRTIDLAPWERKDFMNISTHRMITQLMFLHFNKDCDYSDYILLSGNMLFFIEEINDIFIFITDDLWNISTKDIIPISLGEARRICGCPEDKKSERFLEKMNDPDKYKSLSGRFSCC